MSSRVTRGISRGGEVDTVIEGTMLSNGDNNRLMIGRRVDRAKTISTIGNTGSDINTEDTVHSSSVNTFEEGKHLGVCWSSLTKGCQLLNNEVRVADDKPILELLGCSKVTLICVDKVTSDEILNIHRNGKVGVSRDSVTVSGVREFGRGHVRNRRDSSDRCWVARTSQNLQTISDGKVSLGKTVVDEVVVRCKRSNLTSFCDILPVLHESSRDNSGVEY